MKIDEFIERNNRLGVKEYYPGEKCAIYLICDKKGEIIYIGSTKNIDLRLSVQNKREVFNETIKYYFEYPKDKYIKKEKELIQKIKPKINIFWIKNLKKPKWQRFYLNIKTIKRKMGKLGWDIARFAKEMNSDKGSLSYTLLSGHSGPKTLTRIAQALDIDPKDLLI